MSEDNKYEYLNDEYENLPSVEKIQRTPDIEGTMPHRPIEQPRRRTIRKARELLRKLKEVHEESGTKEW